MSAGPVLKWLDYQIQGFKDIALIVGSYHLIPGADHTTLRIFFGEGDKFSCWEDLSFDRIQWLRLDSAFYSKSNTVDLL